MWSERKNERKIRLSEKHQAGKVLLANSHKDHSQDWIYLFFSLIMMMQKEQESSVQYTNLEGIFPCKKDQAGTKRKQMTLRMKVFKIRWNLTTWAARTSSKNMWSGEEASWKWWRIKLWGWGEIPLIWHSLSATQMITGWSPQNPFLVNKNWLTVLTESATWIT